MHNKIVFFFCGDLLLIRCPSARRNSKAPSVQPDRCTVTSRPIASIVEAARSHQCPRTNAYSRKINYFLYLPQSGRRSLRSKRKALCEDRLSVRPP